MSEKKKGRREEEGVIFLLGSPHTRNEKEEKLQIYHPWTDEPHLATKAHIVHF